MNSKILIADDSLTIQKVIGITLANSGYHLTECIKEEDLISKISSEKFDLVLLDFNLSDTKSGYDFALEIKKHLPKAGIIVMLGTFDTVDDSKFEECGINDKIVKPFESSKFIKKCKDVLENSSNISFEFKPSKKETEKVTETTAIESIDSWVVDAPVQQDHSNFEEEKNVSEVKDTLDPLNSEIKGWGFDPSENLEQKYNKNFPPVIEEKAAINVVERLKSSAAFIENESEESFDDSTNPTFEVPTDLNKNLLSEIDDEVSTEAFWAVDEVLPVKSEESESIEETRLDEVTADLTDAVRAFKAQNENKNEEIFFEANSEVKEIPSSEIYHSIDLDQLVEKLKVALLPQIEKMVRDYCRETAEKVSWEVVPDLAENLIKKELKEISGSI